MRQTPKPRCFPSLISAPSSSLSAGCYRWRIDRLGCLFAHLPPLVRPILLARRSRVSHAQSRPSSSLAMPPTPNPALQRTPDFAVQLPSAGGDPTGSVTGCAPRREVGAGGRSVLCRTPAQPAPSPRAEVLPRATPGPESLSLGSFGTRDTGG